MGIQEFIITIENMKESFKDNNHNNNNNKMKIIFEIKNLNLNLNTIKELKMCDV